MRKPRDIDAELKVLADKAKDLKARRVMQLGELVTLTGADTLHLSTLAGALVSAVTSAKTPQLEEAWRAEGAAFFKAEDAKSARRLAATVRSTLRTLRRVTIATRRAEAIAARIDTRNWMMHRRERTRQLIELGGLVQKAGLVKLTEDDRATLLGGMMALADMLGGDDGAQLAEVWRQRGKRMFEAQHEDAQTIL